jgi:hypothetical protein
MLVAREATTTRLAPEERHNYAYPPELNNFRMHPEWRNQNRFGYFPIAALNRVSKPAMKFNAPA